MTSGLTFYQNLGRAETELRFKVSSEGGELILRSLDW